MDEGSCFNKPFPVQDRNENLKRIFFSHSKSPLKIFIFW